MTLGRVGFRSGRRSFLGAVATATLNNHQYGKEAMEGAMADMGEIETTKS